MWYNVGLKNNSNNIPASENLTFVSKASTLAFNKLDVNFMLNLKSLFLD